MDSFSLILEKLRYPIIVWGKENGAFLCLLTNNKVKNVKKGTPLDKYLQNYEEFKDKYDDFATDKVIFSSYDKVVVLDRITDDLFFEAHYPKCSNINILHSISNKIRTPLTNIIGIIFMMEDTKMTDKQIKYLNIIKKSSYDIVNVVNDLIDIINLEKNEVKLQIDNVDIYKMVEDISKIVSDDIYKNNNTLKISIDDDVPQFLNIDKTRVEQIVINLLKNSMDYTQNGVISLSICKEDKVNKHKIIFKIKDNGSGMTDDMKSEIDSLLKNDTSNIGKSYNQPGFGLTIARYLVNLMNGKIWYKSEIDIGTVFYVTIMCDKSN